MKEKNNSKKEKISERKEALVRIPVGIISYIILHFWTILVFILVLFQLAYVIITGKRNKPVATFCNQYIAYLYTVWRYLAFTTDSRPFPFNDFQKPFEKVN